MTRIFGWAILIVGIFIELPFLGWLFAMPWIMSIENGGPRLFLSGYGGVCMIVIALAALSGSKR